MLEKSTIRPFVIALTFLLFLLSACGTLLGISTALDGKADFRQLYTAGYMVRTGHRAQLYDYEHLEAFQNQAVSPGVGALPFNHLAYESLLFVPLSILKYRAAYALFFGLNLAVLAGCLWMLRPYLAPLREVWTFLPVAMFVSFLPVALALLQGQDSLILLALMISATVMLEHRKDLKGGMLLGLTLFKFQYALPIVLLFTVWRRWRFISGFVISATIVIGLSLWITGWGGFVSYAHSLVEMSAKFSPLYSDRFGIRPQFMPNVRGLAYMFAGGSSLGTHAIVLVFSGIVLAWTTTRRPSLPYALVAAFLVSYHGLITDMSLMALPLGWALAQAIGEEGRIAVRVASIASVIFASPSVLLLAGNRFYLLALPLMALIVVWKGQRSPVATSPNQAACRGTVSTNGNAFWKGRGRGSDETGRDLPNPIVRAT